MYELIVLSLLMQSPFHAYLIAKIANETLGPWEKISKGTLSTLLSKLEKTGLIAPADPASIPFSTDRRSRVFAITSTGRERFFQLMMDTTSNLGAYQKIFRIKSLHLEFLSFEDQLYLVNHYLNYCQTAIHHLQVELQDFKDTEKHKHSSNQFYKQVRNLLHLQIEQWKLEVAWVQDLREQIVSHMEQSDSEA